MLACFSMLVDHDQALRRHRCRFTLIMTLWQYLDDAKLLLWPRLQALQGGVLTGAMLEHLTSEQSEWLLAHLATTNGSNRTADGSRDDGGGGDGDGGSSSPVAVAMTASDQHAALTDFLVGATASGEQLSSQHYGCLAPHCQVGTIRCS